MSNDESVTTSDKGYTDADVLNAWTALRQGPCATRTLAISAVLDAVAPAIVARAKAEALREAADEAALWLGDGVSGHTSTYSVRRWLRKRADEIERGER